MKDSDTGKREKISHLSGGTAAVHGMGGDDILAIRGPVEPQHVGSTPTLLV